MYEIVCVCEGDGSTGVDEGGVQRRFFLPFVVAVSIAIRCDVF